MYLIPHPDYFVAAFLTAWTGDVVTSGLAMGYDRTAVAREAVIEAILSLGPYLGLNTDIFVPNRTSTAHSYPS